MHISGLIGLIIGFIFGICTMQIKNKYLYRKNILQEDIVKKHTKKLNEYQKELSNYFNENIKLLNVIAENYQQLYQHIIKSSNILLDNKKNIKKKLFKNIQEYNHHNTINDDLITEAPRDYPENNIHT